MKYQWLHGFLGAEKNDQNAAYRNEPGENIDRFKRSDYATHTYHIYIYNTNTLQSYKKYMVYTLSCVSFMFVTRKKNMFLAPVVTHPWPGLH